MSYDRCLLSDIWCQVSFIRHLMTGVCYQTSDIRNLMSGVCYQMCDDRCLISDVWCQMSDVRFLLSDIWYQTSGVRCLLLDVWCQMSDDRCLISGVCYQTSDVRFLLSDVWFQMSDDRCLISGVWYQASLCSGINCVHCDNHFFIFISFPQFIYDLFQILLTKNITILINAKKPMMAFFTLLTVNVCSCVPWNASIRWMTPPLADSKIILPSELNFTPVHSMLGSFWMWKVENGPCENRWKKKKESA